MFFFDGKPYATVDDVAADLNISTNAFRKYRKKYHSDKEIIDNCNIFNLDYVNDEGIRFNDARSLCKHYRICYNTFRNIYNSGKSISDTLTYLLSIKDLLEFVDCRTIAEFKRRFYLSDIEVKNLLSVIENEKKFSPDMLDSTSIKPLNDYKRHATVVFEGVEYYSYKDLCKSKGIKYDTFLQRRNRGFSVEEALRPVKESKVYRYNGKIYHSIKQLAKDTGISSVTLRERLNNGMSIEEAIAKGINHKRTRVLFYYNGRPYCTLKQLAADNNISYSTIRKRIKDGMSVEDALNMPHRTGNYNKIVYKDTTYYSYKDLCEKLNLKYSKFMYYIRTGSTIEESVDKCISTSIYE